MRPVKCRICGNKLPQKSAFKVEKDGKNLYYCNKEEYLNFMKREEQKKEAFEFVKIMLPGVRQQLLNSEFNKLSEEYEFEHIYECIKDSEQYLNWVMNHKHFDSQYGKARYFFTIIKNKMAEFEWQPVKERVAVEVESDFQINYKYKQKASRKALIEIELNFDDEEY